MIAAGPRSGLSSGRSGARSDLPDELSVERHRDLAGRGLSTGVGNLLAHQRGREREAEQVYRDALQSGWVEPGDVGTLWRNLGRVVQADKSRRAASVAAYRRAIKAGATEALLGLSMLLLKQKGREREAKTVYLEAVRAGYRSPGVVRLAAAVKHSAVRHASPADKRLAKRGIRPSIDGKPAVATAGRVEQERGCDPARTASGAELSR